MLSPPSCSPRPHALPAQPAPSLQAFRAPTSRDVGPQAGEEDAKGPGEQWIEEDIEEEDPAELAHHRMMKEDLNHVLLTLSEVRRAGRHAGGLCEPCLCRAVERVRRTATAALPAAPPHASLLKPRCRRPHPGPDPPLPSLPFPALQRECGIIKMRYGLDDGEEKTLEEVGKAFNVSAGRWLEESCCPAAV